MSEMKPCLVWVAEYDDDSDYLNVMERLDTQGKYEGVTICRLHGEASADLIAEAGTVFHTTGMTPMQLVERVKELEGVLHAAVDIGMVPTSSASDGGASKHSAQVHVADRIRAALAKCQGEKE